MIVIKTETWIPQKAMEDFSTWYRPVLKSVRRAGGRRVKHRRNKEGREEEMLLSWGGEYARPWGRMRRALARIVR